MKKLLLTTALVAIASTSFASIRSATPIDFDGNGYVTIQEQIVWDDHNYEILPEGGYDIIDHDGVLVSWEEFIANTDNHTDFEMTYDNLAGYAAETTGNTFDEEGFYNYVGGKYPSVSPEDVNESELKESYEEFKAGVYEFITDDVGLERFVISARDAAINWSRVSNVSNGNVQQAFVAAAENLMARIEVRRTANDTVIEAKRVLKAAEAAQVEARASTAKPSGGRWTRDEAETLLSESGAR